MQFRQTRPQGFYCTFLSHLNVEEKPWERGSNLGGPTLTDLELGDSC